MLTLHQAELLDVSIIHGDGTTTAAKRGGDNIGFNGHKKTDLAEPPRAVVDPQDIPPQRDTATGLISIPTRRRPTSQQPLTSSPCWASILTARTGTTLNPTVRPSNHGGAR